MAGNLVGYPVYGDYREPNPPARIVTVVEEQQIDIAAVWGPLAGYFAKQSPVPLVLTPITGTERFTPLRFQYDIAIGVRKNDHGLRAKLDDVLARKHNQITTLLESYGIPLVAATSELTNSIAATSTK
jgi:mxaJ protein